METHSSDCAIYDEPAYRAGKCNCGYTREEQTMRNVILTIGKNVYRLEFDLSYDMYRVYENDLELLLMPFSSLEETKSYLFNYLLERSANGEIEFPNISIGHSEDYKIKTVDLHEEGAPDFSTAPSLAEKYASGEKVAFCGASTTYTFADGSTLRIIADIGKVPK